MLGHKKRVTLYFILSDRSIIQHIFQEPLAITGASSMDLVNDSIKPKMRMGW